MLNFTHIEKISLKCHTVSRLSIQTALRVPSFGKNASHSVQIRHKCHTDCPGLAQMPHRVSRLHTNDKNSFQTRQITHNCIIISYITEMSINVAKSTDFYINLIISFLKQFLKHTLRLFIHTYHMTENYYSKIFVLKKKGIRAKNNPDQYKLQLSFE